MIFLTFRRNFKRLAYHRSNAHVFLKIQNQLQNPKWQLAPCTQTSCWSKTRNKFHFCPSFPSTSPQRESKRHQAQTAKLNLVQLQLKRFPSDPCPKALKTAKLFIKIGKKKKKDLDRVFPKQADISTSFSFKVVVVTLVIQFSPCIHERLLCPLLKSPARRPRRNQAGVCTPSSTPG